MYTYSHSHVQTEVSRSSRSKKLNEGLELDVPSIYDWLYKSGCHRRQDDGFVGPMYLTFSNIR